MSYHRVIPRDLFNEANLLKCLGRLALLKPEHLPESLDDFGIMQDENDGSLMATNVTFTVRGKSYLMRRPLNSRKPWPLYVCGDDDEDIEVFDDAGNLTPAFIAFVEEAAP